MLANADLTQPDLIPIALVITPASPIAQGGAVIIQVTIKNHGTRVANNFWVDLYIDPIHAPNPQETWQQLCASPWPNSTCFGAAWHVVEPLQPGQSLTLTTQTSDSAYSHWLGYFNLAGPHTLYTQVDSYGDDGTRGNLDESEEQNNVLGPIDILIGSL